MIRSLTFALSRLPLSKSRFSSLSRPLYFCSLSPAPSSSALSRAHSLAYAPPRSVYVHLPFCIQKCHYCDFTVNISQDAHLHQAYIDLLEREIHSQLAVSSPADVPRLFDTVYLGGGTPSLLSASQLLHVLAQFPVAPGAEVTIEMDPATFDECKAAALRPHVTRVSLGVQSTHDQALQLCGRKHTRRDVFNALDILQNAGYKNVSVDLISGLPSVTVSQFAQSIEHLLAYDIVRHFSIYDLTLEKATPFGRKYRPGSSPLPSESDSVRCLNIAQQLLCGNEPPFERYEISNYARKDTTIHNRNNSAPTKNAYRSRHNMNYWTGRSFYAFGVGATSFFNGTRFQRPRTISAYKRFVEEDAAQIPVAQENPDESVLEDYLINRFRLLIDGLPLGELPDDVARRLRTAVARSQFVEDGLLEYIDDGAILRMTSAGGMIENTLLSTLLEDTIWSS